MAVFNPNTIERLKYALQNLANRYIKSIDITLSPDEFIASFIKPEHVEKLREVRDICGDIGATAFITTSLHARDGRWFPAHLSFWGEAPILMPTYTQQGLQPTAPESVRAKLDNYIEERLRVGYMFGDAVSALEELNNRCGDKRAFAVMFPVLPALLNEASIADTDRFNKNAKALVGFKGVGDLPKLPLEVKRRLQDVSSLLLACTMIETSSTTAEQPPPGSVTVSFHDYGWATAKATKKARPHTLVWSEYTPYNATFI